MTPPVEINLPSGLRIMMFPKPAKYRWWPWGKIEEGETEAELYKRFAQAIRQVDFRTISDLYDPPIVLGTRAMLPVNADGNLNIALAAATKDPLAKRRKGKRLSVDRAELSLVSTRPEDKVTAPFMEQVNALIRD